MRIFRICFAVLFFLASFSMSYSQQGADSKIHIEGIKFAGADTADLYEIKLFRMGDTLAVPIQILPDSFYFSTERGEYHEAGKARHSVKYSPKRDGELSILLNYQKERKLSAYSYLLYVINKSKPGSMVIELSGPPVSKSIHYYRKFAYKPDEME